MKRLLLALCLITSAAFAEYYEGKSVSSTFERTAVQLDREASRQLTLSSPIYYVTTEYVWEDILIPVLVCEEITLEGDWKGVYDTRRDFDERAASLAEAIKGVGEATAPELLPYLLNKPATWEEFSAIIKFADQQIGHGLSYKVLSEYGQENMVNLGYYSEELCELEWKVESNLVPKIQKEFSHNEVQKFEIRIEDAPLTYGEKENFTIRFDGFNSSIDFTTYYNNYTYEVTTEGDLVVYNLVGNRKQVTPKNLVDVNLTMKDGQAYINLYDNGFISERGQETTVEVTIYRSVPFWFDKRLDTVTLAINEKRTSLPLEIKALKEGKKYYVSYKIKRHDQLLFNDRMSDKKKSQKIEL